MKKTLSFITALVMTASSLGALAVNAVDSDASTRLIDSDEKRMERLMSFVPLTCKEYFEMDDEAFLEYFDGIETDFFSFSRVAACGFGDDTVDDESKFSAYLYYAKRADANRIRRNFLTNGDGKAYITVSPKHYKDPLNYDLTAADLGLCDDWEVTVRDYPMLFTECHYQLPDGSFEYRYLYGGDYHDYAVYFPDEVYRDFEQYIRLEAATLFISAEQIDRQNGLRLNKIYDDFGARSCNLPVIHGDANCDGEVGIADATAIMQSIGNPDEYALDGYGKVCADCCDFGDGVTPIDALTVLEYEAGIIEHLPKVSE